LIIATAFFNIPIEFVGLKNGFAKPLFVLIMSVALVGIWEELYFRGLVYNTFLKNNFGFHLSAFVSSILFSVIHWSSFNMYETSWLWYIGIIFIGYILAFIYTITNSIWSVASFHFIWNFMVRLLDNQENEIGLYEITNYAEHSKTLDNIMVMILGLVLIVILLLTRKKTVLEKINSYISQITSANKS
jgi:membrane protease YdiL (CAAX protease family)